jgi:hypothetical protein
MPALQFGPGGRGGRSNFSKPFIPNSRSPISQQFAAGRNQPHNQSSVVMSAFGAGGRLAGNSSVTIQVRLKNRPIIFCGHIYYKHIVVGV